MTIQSTVIVDLVGMKNFTKAQSYTLMVIGVGSLLGTPIVGKPIQHKGMTKM